MRTLLHLSLAVVALVGCSRTLPMDLLELGDAGAPSDAGAPADASPSSTMDVAPGGFVIGVSAKGTGTGIVRSEPEGIACGSDCLAAFDTETVTLAAEPAANSAFTGWQGACSGTHECVVSRRDGLLARALANFDRVPVALHVRTDGTGSGSVSGDGGIQCPSTCDASVGMDTTVKLMPTPASGSLFTGWKGCTSTQGIACLVTMTATTEVVATFDACDVPTADGPRYVDHILGHDDAIHGGGAGACAYRTISYALDHAPSDIYLAHGNYPGNVAEDDKALYLTGNQVLHGDAADRTAVVLNPHPTSAWGKSVFFAGARNGVDHCTFEGPTSQGIIAIQVSSHPASVVTPHFIVDNVFRGMSIQTIVWQGDVHIEKNVFRETLNTAIQWSEASTTSQLVDNDFIGTGGDINCTVNGGSPGLVGHGNKAGGGGAIQCYGCANCPFL